MYYMLMYVFKTEFFSQVEGFTVMGRVKGHSGASIFINGVLKATSNHDGTFSIPNMKPGQYEFEVTAGNCSHYYFKS